MCGIVGYIGDKCAADVLIPGLKKLEYRGYDSCGIALIKDGKILARKTHLRVEKLEILIKNTKEISILRYRAHIIPFVYKSRCE